MYLNLKKKKITKPILVLLSIIMLAWFIGFLFFISSISKHPDDNESMTDAIVVWTGWNCRVSTGIDLLSKGLSSKLFISGIKGGYPILMLDRCQTSYNSNDLQHSMRQNLDHIHLGRDALTTVGNSIETSRWVRDHNLHSVRLVTTGIHMPRSMIEFRRVMPDIEVIPHPVSLDHFDHRRWYRNGKVFYICALEYTKFLMAKCGFHTRRKQNV